MTKLYQLPISDELRAQIWADGQISPLNFMKIAAWKSAQNLAEITVNTESDFRAITTETLTVIAPLAHLNALSPGFDWDEWERVAASAIGTWNMSGLMNLRGVAYPVATAVLSVMIPQVFPVLDRWALNGLLDVPLTASASSKWHYVKKYREYAEKLARTPAGIEPRNDTIHERDKFFMNLARQRSDTSKR